MTSVTGLRVLDLGSGSGRDCYVCSSLVGEAGSVTGIDMTKEQIQVSDGQSLHVQPLVPMLQHVQCWAYTILFFVSLHLDMRSVTFPSLYMCLAVSGAGHWVVSTGPVLYAVRTSSVSCVARISMHV